MKLTKNGLRLESPRVIVSQRTLFVQQTANGTVIFFDGSFSQFTERRMFPVVNVVISSQDIITVRFWDENI